MRHHNHFKPDTDARCKTMELVVVAPGKEDLNLYEWYINIDTLSERVVAEKITVNEIEFNNLYAWVHAQSSDICHYYQTI